MSLWEVLIVRFLIENVKCFTLFATHFHDLGNLEKCYPNIVSNVHVKALISDRDVDALEVSLLYKVVSGVGHESLGIHVAQVVGFPSECIKVSIYGIIWRLPKKSCRPR